MSADAPHTSESLIEALRQTTQRLEEAAARFEERVAFPEFATVNAAARALGIGTKALRGAVGRGEVRVYHLGTGARGRPRVHVPEVREWALSTAFDPYSLARSAGEAAARSHTPNSVTKPRETTHPQPAVR